MRVIRWSIVHLLVLAVSATALGPCLGAFYDGVQRAFAERVQKATPSCCTEVDADCCGTACCEMEQQKPSPPSLPITSSDREVPVWLHSARSLGSLKNGVPPRMVARTAYLLLASSPASLQSQHVRLDV